MIAPDMNTEEFVEDAHDVEKAKLDVGVHASVFVPKHSPFADRLRQTQVPVYSLMLALGLFVFWEEETKNDQNIPSHGLNY